MFSCRLVYSVLAIKWSREDSVYLETRLALLKRTCPPFESGTPMELAAEPPHRTAWTYRSHGVLRQKVLGASAWTIARNR